MKPFFKTLGIAALGGAMSLGGYTLITDNQNTLSSQIATSTSKIPISNVAYDGNGNLIDFTGAADATVHSVVHVKNKTIGSSPAAFDFYSGRPIFKEAVGTGSGVIITEDGYIVTNNHVIANSRDLEITLNNNKSYKAKIVGTDVKSDIALLKIETDEALPYLTFGDSNNTLLGEWVLAVGNPFNLTSTVTAGIISAKGRDLDTEDLDIQSYLQTDAAVNPGNSGGALVNTRGELIGINTAIASRTGSYVGYSFAVPSNNVRKIIEDIMEFGFVQKGMLGISGQDLNGSIAKELGVKNSEGIYIRNIVDGSGAAKAGLREGDVITKVDGLKMRSFADLTGFVNTKNPGDKVTAEINRGGETKSLQIEISKNSTVTIPNLNMELRDLTKQDKAAFKTNTGVRISGTTGDLKQYGSSLQQFVITKINNKEVRNVNDVQSIINQLKSRETVYLEMKNTDGQIERFRYQLD